MLRQEASSEMQILYVRNWLELLRLVTERN